MRVTIHPSSISGSLSAPPSKSMAHRALICAALAEGESHITNLSGSEDISATCRALTLLGAKFTPEGENGVCVTGTGGHIAAPEVPVDCGESGSTLRFLIPVFARCGKPITFTGHGRLMERPQTVYAELFKACSIPFSHTDEAIRVYGALPAGSYTVRGDVSSQFISGLLFALPLARGTRGESDQQGKSNTQGENIVRGTHNESVLHITPPFESRSYIALTLAALADFGIAARFGDENTICIDRNQKYAPCNYTVEGDYSQAAFLAVLGALCGGVTVTGLRPDTKQGDAAILDILARCGARFTRAGGTCSGSSSSNGSCSGGTPSSDTSSGGTPSGNTSSVGTSSGGTPSGDTSSGGTPSGNISSGGTCAGDAVTFEKSSLHGTRIDLADCPDLGPVLMALGAFCAGETVIENAGRLRLKESDRIEAMETELRKLGADISSTPDTVTIRGGALHGASDLCGHNDHRVVMALTVAALAAGVPAAINGAEAVRKSWPGFFAAIRTLGAEIAEQPEAVE